jgi:hypothetical protein
VKPSSTESDGAPTLGQMACIWLLFLPAWTIITVILDLVLAVGLDKEGFTGEIVFFVVFAIPFNASLVLLWTGPVIHLFGTRAARLFAGTGIRVLEYRPQVRVRLPRMSPFLAAFLAAFVLPILVVLTLGMTTGPKPPLVVAVATLILILSSIVGAFLFVARRNATGRTDLVIDRFQRTCTFPPAFGRREPVTVSCADLEAINVVTERKKDNEGHETVAHAVIAMWHDAQGGVQQARLAELSRKDAAEVLVASILQAVGGHTISPW